MEDFTVEEIHLEPNKYLPRVGVLVVTSFADLYILSLISKKGNIIKEVNSGISTLYRL